MATYNEIYKEAQGFFEAVYAMYGDPSTGLLNPGNTSYNIYPFQTQFLDTWIANKTIKIDEKSFYFKDVIEACPEDRKIRYNPGDPKSVTMETMVNYLRYKFTELRNTPNSPITLEEVKKEQVLFLTAVLMGGLKVLGVNTPKPKLGNYTSV